MAILKNTDTVYPLSPSQKLIMFQQAFCIAKNVVQIPFSFITCRNFDFDIMKRAITEEIKRNDCLRLRFFRKRGKIYQRFIAEYDLENIPVYEFKTAEEQEKTLTADAERPIRFLNDETFRMILFRTHDGKSGVYINVHHTVMDGMAVGIFFNDLCRVYDSIESGSEMPAPLDSFEESLKRDLAAEENTEKREKDAEFWKGTYIDNGKPIYSGVEGPWLLEKYRKKHKDPNYGAISIFHPFNERSEYIAESFDGELMGQVRTAAMSINVSPADFIQAAYRIYLSANNRDTGDVTFFDLCARRVLRADRNTCGCRCHAVYTRSQFKITDSFDEVAKQLAVHHLQAFRHADISTMELLKIENVYAEKQWAEAYSGIMFTYMPEPPMRADDKWKRDYFGYNPGKFAYPMYLYCHENANTGGLNCNYLYRVVSTTGDDVRRFHDGTKTILRAAADDPTMTVAELKKLWFR